MPAEFEDLLGALDSDAGRLPLAPADRLRSAGEARNRRRNLAVGGVFVVVVTFLAGAGLAVASLRPEPGPVGPPTTSTTPVPTTTAPGPIACTAGDLVFVGATDGAAMGSAYRTYTLRNRATVACRLQGAPGLGYRADGSAAMVPIQRDTADAVPVVLAPGRTAAFTVRTVNGYGGYQPDSPECARPMTYRELTAIVAGSAVALGSGLLAVQCGEVTVSAWTDA
jgi:hypothetical protein